VAPPWGKPLATWETRREGTLDDFGTAASAEQQIGEAAFVSRLDRRAKATGRRWYSGDGGCWLWKAVEAARPELGLGQMFWCGYGSIRTRQADILLRR
jgi:hypothetical protein